MDGSDYWTQRKLLDERVHLARSLLANAERITANRRAELEEAERARFEFVRDHKAVLEGRAKPL